MITQIPHTLLLITGDPAHLDAFTGLQARQALAADSLVVATLEEGLASLAQRPFTHILADVSQLPPDNPSLWSSLTQRPLILLAGPGQETAVAHALEAGAASYLIADPQRQWQTLLPALLRQTAVNAQAISENQGMAEALATSERHLRTVLTTLPDLVLRLQRDGVFLDYYVSRSDDLAMPPEQFVGKNVREVMPADLAEKTMQALARVAATGKEVTFEYDLPVHGQQRSYEARLVQFEADECLVIIRNLTSRRQMQKALRESEEKYRSLVESSDSAIVLFNPDGQLLYINQIAAQAFGGTPDALVGKGLSEIFPPEMAEPQLQVLRQVAQTGEGLVLEESAPIQGVTNWYRNSIQPVRNEAGGVTAILVNAINVTAIKQAEVVLRSREARLLGLLESQTNYVVRVDLAGKHTYWNKKFAEDFAPVYGGEAELMQGDALLSICDYHHDRTRQTVENCLTQPGVVFQVELDKPTGDGRIETTLWEFVCLTDDNGQPWEVQCVGVNITALKKAEIALRASERRYRQMFEQHSLPKLIIDYETGAIVSANPAAAQFYGHDLAHLCEMTLFDLSDAPPKRLLASLAQAVADDLPVLALKQRRGDGSLRDVELFGGPLELDGRLYLYALISDVTERAEAQRALQEAYDLLERRVQERTAALAKSELRYRALFNQSNDAVFILDTNGKHLQVNQRASDLLGYTATEMVGRSAQDIVWPDEVVGSRTILARLMQGERIPIYKRVFRHKDGRAIPAEINVELVRDEDGAPLHVQSIVRDISEREAQEQRLRFHASLQQTVTDAVMSLDNEYRIQSWNTAAEKLYGFTAAEALGKVESDLLLKEYPDNFTTEVARTYLREHGFAVGEVRVRRKDGRWLWVLFSASQIKDENGRLEGYIAITRDITANKEAEIALRLSEQRYRNIVDTQTDLICRYAPDLTLTFVNDAYCRYFGKTREELIGRNFLDLIPPGEREAARNHCHDLLANPRIVAYEHKAVDAIGKQRWQAWIDTVILDDEGQPQEVQAVGRDITERKEMEEALRQSEERLELAARAGGIGVWDWDLVNNTLHWDERMRALYGLPAHQTSITYDTWVNALHPDDVDKETGLMKASLPETRSFDTEFRIIKPNGEVRHIMSLAHQIRDEAGSPTRMVGINMDISARKEAERALRAALEKERELSELKTRFVSIASHEFRTPLAAILATTETLSLYRGRMDEAKIDARLDKIRQQVSHMKLLIDDVLQLDRIQAGRVEFRPAAHNLNELCRQIIHEFNSQPAHHERVVCACDRLPAPILFDKQLLRQAMNNLISNGLKYSSPDTPVTVKVWVHNGQICLTVHDRGIGIPPEAGERLFEPFYRARNATAISGTGLGLSIARQAVEMHGGTLAFTSEPDAGTTFTITMPLRQPGSGEHD